MRPRFGLDIVGAVGAILAALCCLGVAAVVSLAASLGLAFLIDDAVLLPLLLLFLLVDWTGLYLGRRRHGRLSPLVAGVLAGAALPLFAFFVPVRAAAYAAIAGLIAASVLNAAYARRGRRGTPS